MRNSIYLSKGREKMIPYHIAFTHPDCFSHLPPQNLRFHCIAQFLKYVIIIIWSHLREWFFTHTCIHSIRDFSHLRWLTREAFFLSFCVGFYTSLVVSLFEVSVRASQKYEFWLLETLRIEIEEIRVLFRVKFFFQFERWKFFYGQKTEKVRTFSVFWP